jgi:inhibitor of cysteine peptidase
MRIFIRLCLGVVFAFMFVVSAAIAEQSPNKVFVKAGKTFVITLEANHTTGYSWQLAANLPSKSIVMVDSDYISDPAPKGMVGVGGREEWTFKTLKPWKGKLKFMLVRPWEKDVLPVNTRVIIVQSIK